MTSKTLGIIGGTELARRRGWKLLTVLITLLFFGLAVRWSCLDNRPPAWDQGLYLFEATLLHRHLMQNGLFDFLVAAFQVDRGRVPLLLLIVQPAFAYFGPNLKVAVIVLNLFWFPLAWALAGITRLVAQIESRDRAAFFAVALFGLYPVTTMLSHDFLVELPLVSFVTASIYALLKLTETKARRWSCVAGVLIGLGMLTKVTFPVFLAPVFLLVFYHMCRETSLKHALRLCWPAVLISLIICAPYYAYNAKPILQLTALLSSHELSRLYGFGDALGLAGISAFLTGTFLKPVFIISALLLIFCKVRCFNTSSNFSSSIKQHKIFWLVMLVWFTIPVCLTMVGEIKETRYAFPALVPIFIITAIAVGQNFRSGSVRILTLSFLFLLPEYLYSNGLLNEKTENFFGSTLKLDSGLVQNSAPDGSDWHVKELVNAMDAKLVNFKEEKVVLFLGGNRFFHLRLLDYQGLIEKTAIKYVHLPYYEKPDMTVDEALAFIAKVNPVGIIRKSGENWPAFSSRLDEQIVARLANDAGYEKSDLGIHQPDGSRFTFFVRALPVYAPVASLPDLAGFWRVGLGTGEIATNGPETFSIITEAGAKATGMLVAGEIRIPAWQVTGKVTADLATILWSNGSVWKRKTITSKSLPLQ